MDIKQNNDDLQNAISGASDLDKMQTQFGVPPVPQIPTPASMTMPTVGTPATDTNQTVTGIETMTIPMDTPSTSATGSVSPELAPAADVSLSTEPTPELGVVTDQNATVAPDLTSETPVDDDLENIKKQMLADLYPLMDKIKVNPEEKYRIYKKMIESTHDKKIIDDAYAVTKELTDESVKAEALLFLLEEADK